jgi:hypothetical protein
MGWFCEEKILIFRRIFPFEQKKNAVDTRDSSGKDGIEAPQ